MSLKFNERVHKYWLDGKPVPGVTTLIGKGLPKPAIPYWAARTVAEYVADNPDGVEALRTAGRAPMVAALKEVPWQKRDEAAIRGTDVHALAEQIIHGQSVDVPDHLLAHVEGYVRWLDAFAVEALHTETPIANRSAWYAGTFDVILRFGRGPWAGRTVLADNKTSSGVYGETGLQTAAYAKAEFMAPEPDSEIAMPEIEATGVIHITAEGSRFHPLAESPAAIDEAFGLFRHISWVAQRTEWIKGLVGEPFVEPEVA
ncbi:MAG: hypothetical protein M0Z51_11135 [Propionibacterium sp.]|nr:hypothetical protein [Propionibacterium sp.]